MRFVSHVIGEKEIGKFLPIHLQKYATSDPETENFANGSEKPLECSKTRETQFLLKLAQVLVRRGLRSKQPTGCLRQAM